MREDSRGAHEGLVDGADEQEGIFVDLLVLQGLFLMIERTLYRRLPILARYSPWWIRSFATSLGLRVFPGRRLPPVPCSR